MGRKNWLKELDIQVTERGFTIWVVDDVIQADGSVIQVRHWVVDGSLVKRSGVIDFGLNDMYATDVEFDERNMQITIVRKPKENPK